MDFKKRILEIEQETSKYENVKVIAATKYMNVDQTKKIVEAGIKCLGENRTDLFLEKYEALKDYDIEWHFFGVLQSRKIKDVVNKIDCLHSLEKLSVAVELDKKLEKPLDCFVQVNISEEPNKQGIPVSKVKPFIKSLSKCQNIRVIGLMCIAKMTYDTEILEDSFKKMKKIKEDIEAMNLEYAPCHELSMGMSNDYKAAIQYGSNIVRIGTAMFGARKYN
jgi:pyridoxal phosphate enzyme (YggS family)